MVSVVFWEGKEPVGRLGGGLEGYYRARREDRLGALDLGK